MKIFIYIFFFTSYLLSCSHKSKQDKLPEIVTSEVKVNNDNERKDISLDYVMGKFDPSTHPDFTLIDKKFATKDGIYLRKSAYTQFVKMHDHAERDGIELVIRSAARNFDYQKGIWERKWTGETKLSGNVDASIEYIDPFARAKAILLYSSMPGTSRHHWGTDIDINNFENSYFEHGRGLKEYAWLQQNAGKYGYCQTYTVKDSNRPEGYEEEKWHWSYMPIARHCLAVAEAQLSNTDIKGFLGSETATQIDVKSKYIFGINPDCK